MVNVRNLVGGRLVDPASGAWLDVIEPATGRPLARVPDSSALDADAAVRCARDAFPAWSLLPAAERARLMNNLAGIVERRLDEFASAESDDTGKPITIARSIDLPRSIANLRHFAGAVLHWSSESHDSDGGGVPGAVRSINYTLRRPRGVAVCISPWNLPLYLLTWKIAPALATGNTVVTKPSEVTPITAHMLAEASIEAGFPPGVLNVIHGAGAGCGAALVEHPDIAAVTFTGSTTVGRWIGRSCGQSLKRVSLELGGKNPFLIFDDAELDGPEGAIATAARAAFSNQGQICLCGSRLLIHAGVYDRVAEGVARAAGALVPGDPRDPETRFGAITSTGHLAKITAAVDRARVLGGRILAGGRVPPPDSLPERCRGGAFHQATVIEGLDPSCEVEQEEIFGPVVTLQRFSDESEALRLANGTAYGLAATVFTRDGTRAHRVSAALDAGIVWVNGWMNRDLRTPFGGVKSSGVGREGGVEALRFFTEPKNVCVRT
ncbi:MAG: aldehyde dehydrogenase [Phycisphaeraceae bacterium]|nr:aldehyde dehydrogenase [Phycisphaerae bacterium]MBX3392670.1 aldehyde dehydrogenase [Phycisphaeraceae bacterium]